MNDFIGQNHYVQLPADKIAGILGWGIDTEDGETHLIDKDQNMHFAIDVRGEDRGTIVDISPGESTTRGAKQFARVFGETRLAGYQRDRIERALEGLGILVKRTVLVEAKPGDEIWGSVVASQVDLRVERADGFVVNTMDTSDARPFRGKRIELTAKSFNTISDAVWDDPDAYDAAFADIIEAMPGMIATILETKAVGNVHVWGVLEGPLNTSQSVCFDDDKPYHVAPDGFVGQFMVPGRAAVWNFIAYVKDGVMNVDRHAL